MTRKTEPKKATPVEKKKSAASFFPMVAKVRIAELIPYLNNAKKHTPEQISALIDEIRDKGFLVPILIDDDNVIVAGHGRVAAAEKMGLTTVPAIRVRHLTPRQIREFRISDNAIPAMTGLDRELLKADFIEAREQGFADFRPAGISEADVAALFAERPSPAPAPKEEPEDLDGPSVQCPHCLKSFKLHGLKKIDPSELKKKRGGKK